MVMRDDEYSILEHFQRFDESSEKLTIEVFSRLVHTDDVQATPGSRVEDDLDLLTIEEAHQSCCRLCPQNQHPRLLRLTYADGEFLLDNASDYNYMKIGTELTAQEDQKHRCFYIFRM